MHSVIPLSPAHLGAAQRVLSVAAQFDNAAIVCAEKLFGGGPPRPQPGDDQAVGPTAPAAVGVWQGAELAGIAAVDGNRIRLLAVVPKFAGRGIGSTLLWWCEQQARAAVSSNAPRVWALGQAGNYLAPGIDTRNVETIAWLKRRGWRESSDIRTNLLVAVRGNPMVTPERGETLAAMAHDNGYVIRRAAPDETAFVAAVAQEFGAAWAFEVARALHWQAGDRGVCGGVFVAVRGSEYCAFAAHDGNNQGAGWFGPAGTWPAHRGQRLGEAVLIQCLLDVARDHPQCEIAWIGPEPFYAKSCGIAGRRTFVAMYRALEE